MEQKYYFCYEKMPIGDWRAALYSDHPDEVYQSGGFNGKRSNVLEGPIQSIDWWVASTTFDPDTEQLERIDAEKENAAQPPTEVAEDDMGERLDRYLGNSPEFVVTDEPYKEVSDIETLAGEITEARRVMTALTNEVRELVSEMRTINQWRNMS